MPVRDERERKGRKDFERVCMCRSARFFVLTWECDKREMRIVKKTNCEAVILCSNLVCSTSLSAHERLVRLRSIVENAQRHIIK